MKSKIYRVLSHQYFDERGVGGKISYFIEYQRKTIFGNYWKRIKHTESIGLTDIGKVTTYFNSIGSCKKFIKETLIPNKPKGKWVTKEELCVNN
ncbi:MAG: hypothetical protein H8E98_05530 [Bacteroidetes bacterium]|nr:hypothetical protein [Bacteroidota bacterium]